MNESNDWNYENRYGNVTNLLTTRDQTDTDMWQSFNYLDSVLKNEEMETKRFDTLLVLIQFQMIIAINIHAI